MLCGEVCVCFMLCSVFTLPEHSSLSTFNEHWRLQVETMKLKSEVLLWINWNDNY